MPYINEQNPELNVIDEQIIQINTHLTKIYNARPVNFLSILEDLIILFKNINPTHEITDAEEFYNLLTLSTESKAIENEIVRKCNLIKFVNSIMNDNNISQVEFNRLCQLIHSHQEIPIAQFIDKVLSAEFHNSILINIMDLVSGYLYVKDALPQSLINIFILKDVKKTNKPQIPRIMALQMLAGDIANLLGDDLLDNPNKTPITQQPNLLVHKPKACRVLNFDNIQDDKNVEMKDFNSTSSIRSHSCNESKVPFEKKYPPAIHKSFIQILFFKHIASDTRVMRLKNNKISTNTQLAIEKICTKISHYVYPYVKSPYEDKVGFKINNFLDNPSSFWNDINYIRAQRRILAQENQIAKKTKNANTQDQSINDTNRANYTEIPDHDLKNPCTNSEQMNTAKIT